MIGRNIHRYRIVGKLGEGGMGSVWLAEDSLLGRKVAIKLLSDRLGESRHARQRFLREARAVCSLSHPGIATVYDAGEDAGTIFIAFERVEGDTVADRVRRGRIPLGEALRLAREAAEALGHAHAQGILHRDVTSRNLMVDRRGNVKVVDFGLALPEGETRITRTGATLGTVGYMAPEVAKGASGDRRSDVYGVGVVLYEMVTGTLPFRGERPESVLYAVVHEAVEPPSRRREGVPEGVDRVLLRALEKVPDRRYQDMEDLIADLRRLEQGEGVEVAAEPEEIRETLRLDAGVGERAAGRPAPGPRRRTRARAVLSFSLRWGVPLAAALALAWWAVRSLRPPDVLYRTIAVLPLQNSSDVREEVDYMSMGISEALATRLTRIPAIQVAPWLTTRRYPPEVLPLKDICQELDVEAVVAGTFRLLGSRVQINLSLVDGKSGMQVWAEEFRGIESDLLTIPEKISVALAKQLKGELSPAEVAALAQRPTDNVDAYKFYLQGGAVMQEGTQSAADMALSLFQKAVDLDPNLAEAYVGIGAVYQDHYSYGWGGGYRSLELAATNFRTALQLNPELSSARRGLIRVFFEKGWSEECLKVGVAVASTDADEVEALSTLGEAYLLAVLPELAIPLFRRIIQLDPMNRGAHWFLVVAEEWAGHHARAVAAGEDWLRRFGEDPEIYTWIGVAHQASGDYEAAEAAYDRAIDLFGAETSHYVYLYSGLLHHRWGREREAREIWREGIRLLEPRVATYPDNLRKATLLAALHGLLGNMERLGELETRAYEAAPDNGYLPLYPGLAYEIRGEREIAADRYLQCLRAGFLGVTWPFFDIPDVREAPEYRGVWEEYGRERNRLQEEYGGWGKELLSGR